MPIRRTHRAIRGGASTLAGPPLPNLIARSSPAWWPRRSRQTRSHPELGRQTLQRPWYCASRPGRVGRRQARQDHAMIHHSLSYDHDTARRPTAAGQDAGWSSPVARQAHNLKAAGSNPAPATNTTTHNPTTKPQGPKPRGQNTFRSTRPRPEDPRRAVGRDTTPTLSLVGTPDGDGVQRLAMPSSLSFDLRIGSPERRRLARRCRGGAVRRAAMDGGAFRAEGARRPRLGGAAAGGSPARLVKGRWRAGSGGD